MPSQSGEWRIASGEWGPAIRHWPFAIRPLAYLPLEKNSLSFGPCSGLVLIMAAHPAS